MSNYFTINEGIFYAIILAWGWTRYHLLHNQRILDLNTKEYPLDAQFQYYNDVLIQDIPYYTQLSEAGKHKFIYRLKQVRESLEFQAREDFNLTMENEILIAACVTQLTFGFKSPIIPYLK